MVKSEATLNLLYGKPNAFLKEAVQGYLLDKLFKVQKSYSPFKLSFYLFGSNA